MDRKKNKRVFISAAAVFCTVFFAALFFGGTKIPFTDALCGIFGKGSGNVSVIMQSVRLPRVIASVIAGAGLSVSGVLLQSVTDNGLASPNIIGINSGAGFLTIVFLCFFPASVAFLPFAAFLGAFGASAIILLISKRIGNSKGSVILAGMALTALLNGGISFVSVLDSDVLAAYNYFSVGGLSGVQMKSLLIPACLVFVSWVLVLTVSDRIGTLSLGDSVATSLGIRVSALRLLCLICASASAAAVVSFAGLLGFVGLVVPHILRRLFGGNIRACIAAAPYVGGALVTLADLLGRVIIAPSEIPVGIVMAFVGAPFFLVVLLRRRKYA